MNRLHQHRRSHISTLRRLSGAAVAAAAISVAIPMTAQAAVACNGPALVAAISAANAAGGGNVVLERLCTYNLTTASSVGANGPNGLPIITTAITLTGDQNLITRSGAIGTPQFRIVEVARS
jgi:hypothetical protein